MKMLGKSLYGALVPDFPSIDTIVTLTGTKILIWKLWVSREDAADVAQNLTTFVFDGLFEPQ